MRHGISYKIFLPCLWALLCFMCMPPGAHAQAVPGIHKVLPDSGAAYRAAGTWDTRSPEGLSLAETGLRHIDAARFDDAESCLKPALMTAQGNQNPFVQGVAWFGLGRLAAARGQYAAAMDAFSKADELLNPGTAQQRTYLVRLYTARAATLLDTDLPDAAIAFLDAATRVAETLDAAAEPLRLDIQFQRARLQEYYGWYDDAAGIFKDNLERRTALLGPAHPDTAASCLALSRLYARANRFDDAWDYGYEALHIFETARGKSHPSTARAYEAMGDLARVTGDFSHAAQLLQQAMDAQEKILGRQHPDHATTSAALGMLYLVTDRYDHAVAALNHALDVDERVLGAHSLAAARDRHFLGITFRERMHLTDAADALTRALAIETRLLGEGHPALADILSDLAAALALRGETEAALLLEKKSMALDAARGPGGDTAAAGAHFNNIGALLLSRGDVSGAIENYEQALHTEQQNPDAAPMRQAAIYNNLAQARKAGGDYEAAAAAYAEALKLTRWSLGLNNILTADAYYNLAECQRKLDDPDEAEKNYKYFLRTTYIEDPRADIVTKWLDDNGRLRTPEPAPPMLPRYLGPEATPANEPDYVDGER